MDTAQPRSSSPCGSVAFPRKRFVRPFTSGFRGACFVEHVPFHSWMTPSAVRDLGLPYGMLFVPTPSISIGRSPACWPDSRALAYLE